MENRMQPTGTFCDNTEGNHRRKTAAGSFVSSVPLCLSCVCSMSIESRWYSYLILVEFMTFCWLSISVWFFADPLTWLYDERKLNQSKNKPTLTMIRHKAMHPLLATVSLSSFTFCLLHSVCLSVCLSFRLSVFPSGSFLTTIWLTVVCLCVCVWFMWLGSER